MPWSGFWFVTGSCSPGTRMMIIVSRTQMAIGDVCVDLRCRNIAVAKQRLDRTRVGAMLQQVSRKAMTQSVRRNILETNLRRVGFYHCPRKLACHWLAAVQEEVSKRRFTIARFE